MVTWKHLVQPTSAHTTQPQPTRNIRNKASAHTYMHAGDMQGLEFAVLYAAKTDLLQACAAMKVLV
eukprot:3959602-Prymnesium_polylepis.1